MSARRTSEVSALLLLVTASWSSAIVPPEVPTRRTSQVFSPFYFQSGENGESVFIVSAFGSLGPVCLQYQRSLAYIQSATPSPNPTVTVDNFVTLLGTPAGILFASSHAGLDGELGVEAHTDQALANQRFDEYRQNGTILSGEGRVAEVGVAAGSPQLWTIAVNNTFINRHLAQHSLVHVQGCHSASLAPGFIDGQHRTRGFIGLTPECPVGQLFQSVGFDITKFIFGNMSGIRNETAAGYANVSLAGAVNAAGAQVYNGVVYRTDGAPRDPSDLRLYNAPRLAIANVTQDTAGNGSFSKSLYHYQFANTYPYNPDAGGAFQNSDYPGTPGQSSVAGQGPVRINLRFSEPMDAGWSQFKVELRFADGSTQDVTSSGNWGSTILPNDNWSGTTTLPASAPDGQATVAVRARKVMCGPGLDANNQELDLDGDGSSTAGAWDTSVTFTKLESAPPTFQMKDPAGVFAPLPSFVTPGTYEFEVRDSGSGIASFTSRHSGASGTENFSTPQPKITRTFTLTAGTLTLEATDAAGNGSAVTLAVDPNPVKVIVAGGGSRIDTSENPAVTSAVFLENAPISIIVRSIGPPLQSLTVTRDGGSFLSRGPADLILGDFVETLPPALPGHYVLEARDQGSPNNPARVTFDVDPYLVRASSKSIALYSEAANSFQTRLTLTVKTAKPLTTLEFRLSDPTPEGAPRFPLVHRFPPLGNLAEFEAALPQDLAPGRYVAVGYAADGVRFASSIDLLDRTTAFAFSAGLTGEEQAGTELTPLQNQPPYSHALALSKSGQNFVPSGEFKSGVYDLGPTAREGPFFDTDFLGGVVIPGNIDPAVAPLPAGDLCGYGLSSIWSGASPGSVDGASPSGEGPRFTLGLRSDVEPLAEQPFSTVVTGQSVFNPFTNCPGSRIFPVKRFVQFKADLTASTAITDCGPTGTNPTCQVWPAGAYSPYDLLPKGFVARANSARYEPTNDPLLESELPAVLDGDEVLVDIPGQGFLRFFNVTTPGNLTVTCGPREAPPGFVAFPSDRSCSYATTAQFGEAEFHLKFDPSQFTPEQLAQLKIVHVTNEATGAFELLQASVVNDTVVGRTAILSPFFIALPVEALVRTASGAALAEGGLPEAVLKSRQGFAPVAVDTSAPPLSDLIAAKAALGYSLVSGLYRIADDGTAFLPPAELLLRYSTGALGSRDLDVLTPGLMALDTTTQQLAAVSGQTTSTETAATAASLPAVHGLVGVFARPNDRAPPATRVFVEGRKYESAEGLLFISPKSSIAFEAADSGTLVGNASGLTTTYFILDPDAAVLQGGLNAGNAHLFQSFAGGVALPEGVHSIAYGSADRAGNFEAARSSQVHVDGTPPSASLAVTGPAVFESSRVIVGAQTFLSFASLDPVSNAVSAGTVAVAALLNQTPESCGLSLDELPAVDPLAPPGSCANPLYSAPFAVPAGTHSLTYFGSPDPGFSDENGLPTDST